LLTSDGPAQAIRIDSKPYIDTLLARSWAAENLRPVPLVSDAEFLRRATLDLTGQAPHAWEVALLEHDHSPDKRPRLIDRLLESDQYARHWAGLWTDALLGPGLAPAERERFRAWLTGQLAAGVSHARLAERLLTATGKPADDPATLFLLSNLGQPLHGKDRADHGHFDLHPATWRSGRVFLGYRLNCVRCHDHPFAADLKQPQFWRSNVLLRQVDRTAAGALVDEPALNAKGFVFYMRRNGVWLAIRPARLLDGQPLRIVGTRRRALAEMIIAHDNFARALVSRAWGQLFGRGLGLQPAADDFGDHNPTEHQELLDTLATDTVAAGYDQRRLLRWLCNSAAYQRQSTYNATNTGPEMVSYFSRMPLKPLPPTVRLDALLRAVRADQTLTPAAQAELRRRWLAVLTPRCDDALDEDVCHEAPPPGSAFEFAQLLTRDATLHQAMNATVRQAMETPNVADELYRAALGRRPTAQETAWLANALAKTQQDGGDPAALWHDVLVTLLGSSEAGINR